MIAKSDQMSPSPGVRAILMVAGIMLSLVYRAVAPCSWWAHVGIPPERCRDNISSHTDN